MSASVNVISCHANCEVSIFKHAKNTIKLMTQINPKIMFRKNKTCASLLASFTGCDFALITCENAPATEGRLVSGDTKGTNVKRIAAIWQLRIEKISQRDGELNWTLFFATPRSKCMSQANANSGRSEKNTETYILTIFIRASCSVPCGCAVAHF